MKRQAHPNSNSNLLVHFDSPIGKHTPELPETYSSIMECQWGDCRMAFMMIEFSPEGNPVCPHCGREN